MADEPTEEQDADLDAALRAAYPKKDGAEPSVMERI